VTFLELDKTKLFLDHIQKMPIMSKAISKIVVKFDDFSWTVREMAINSFVKLANHGNVHDFFI